MACTLCQFFADPDPEGANGNASFEKEGKGGKLLKNLIYFLGTFKRQSILNLFYKVAKIIDMLTQCLPEEKDKVPSIVQFSGQIEKLVLVSN